MSLPLRRLLKRVKNHPISRRFGATSALEPLTSLITKCGLGHLCRNIKGFIKA